jgi:hypothetical protein
MTRSMSFGGSVVASIFLVALLHVSQVDGLKCYVCNSKFNDTCLSPPSPKYLVDCDAERHLWPRSQSSDFKVCRTMWITVGDDAPHIDRRCGWLEQHKDCVNTATFQIKSTTCQCRADGCNPASNAAPAIIVVALSAILALFISRSSA